MNAPTLDELEQPCTRCGSTPARLYAQGRLCHQHSPAAHAGLPEPPDTTVCAPKRLYCPPGRWCATCAAHQPLWRVLATGGRDRDDKTRIWEVFDGIRVDHPRLIVVHGAAYPKPVHGVRPDRSADWLIHQWCAANSVYEETHPADWARHGKAAGPIRNGEMVALDAHECVAFPGTGQGTRDCMRRAAAAGIPVRTIPWAAADQHALFDEVSA